MDNGRIVYVRGIGRTISKEELTIYFQSRKQSGGGDISSIDQKEDEAIITFEEGDARKTALDMDEGRVLYVRGIGRTISKEELTIYFQSRKQSGGGDISSIDLKEDKAIITFEEGDVAKNVGSRTHVINRTQVEVSFQPFIRETQSQETSANQTCVVIIRGLSENTTEDGLLNYFENTRRSGGGYVEEVNIKGDSARIKFESAEVANRVVAQDKHTLNGATLEVSLEICESNEQKGKTIEVAGLAANITEDSICNYFENKRRSGGGEVETVDFRSVTGVAFVTFKDVNVVNSVLQQNKHTLDGVTLSVTACNNTSGFPENEEAQESRTIEVSGLATTTTKDSITMFFENTRRTGGGEVEHVDFTPDLGIAVVTFVKSESARGVVNKGKLALDNAQLKVTIKQPVKKPPTDTTKLLVKGLSDKTTSDGLQCYMEVVSRLEVLSIEFGEQGCALVTFNETYGSSKA
ncbi:hypothetical protein ACROYT_G018654 [Oculina patagonica]